MAKVGSGERGRSVSMVRTMSTLISGEHLRERLLILVGELGPWGGSLGGPWGE